MTIFLVSVGLIAALLIAGGVHDARRRRRGLPVNGPDGLRGFRSTVTGGLPYAGGSAVGSDGGGAGCDAGGGDGGGGGSC